MSEAPKKNKPSDWELEAPLDITFTLQDLIDAPPFSQASDEQGHSATVGARIPSYLVRRIIKLREFPGSPYELNSDVVRDAMYKGLQILYVKYKVGGDTEVEKRMTAIIDATGASRRIRDQFDELVTNLDELQRSGDDDQAAQKLMEYIIAVRELENEWHRDKLIGLLRDSRLVQRLVDKLPIGIQKFMNERKK